MKVVMWHDAAQKAMVSRSIHGVKYLNYAAKDTANNRKEAERLFKARSGCVNVDFVWQQK